MSANSNRGILNRGQRIIQRQELTPYTVSIRLQTFSVPLGDRASAPSEVITTISPTPNVVLISREPATFNGLNTPIASSSGQQLRTTYRISGIFPFNGSIGYTRDQLLPIPTDTTKRAVVWMTGPDLPTAGAPFEVIDYKQGALEIIITIKNVVDYG